MKAGELAMIVAAFEEDAEVVIVTQDNQYLYIEDVDYEGEDVVISVSEDDL